MAASSRHLLEILSPASAAAGVASGTGTAYNARTDHVSALPPAVSGTGAAFSASKSVSVNAGVASGSGVAYDLSPHDADGASGHESEFIEVQISDADTGSGADTHMFAGPIITDSDTGTGAEAQVVLITVPAPGTAGGVRTARWIFVDGSESYPFVINPSETTEIVRSKNLLYQNTLAPQTKTIAFEVNDNVKTFSWSGTTLTQAQYEAFVTWFEKRNEFQLLDDLGRVYNIYVTDFQPKRVRVVDYPWMHTYQMKALVLSEVS